MLNRDSLFVKRKIKDSNNNIIDEKDVYKSKNVAALFESTLTRVLNLKSNEVNDGVVIVKVYHHRILQD